MMRGYRCKNKTAKEILTTLGFDGVSASRGWIMERTGGKNSSGAPIRMHAMIHYENGTEYIDLHADHAGPNNTHVTVRGRRVERFNDLFKQVDYDEPCNAGQKLLAHYDGLRQALEKYEK